MKTATMRIRLVLVSMLLAGYCQAAINPKTLVGACGYLMKAQANNRRCLRYRSQRSNQGTKMDRREVRKGFVI